MEINEKRRELVQLLSEERADHERVIAAGKNFDATEKEKDEKRAQRITQLTTDVTDWDQLNARAQARREAEAAGRNGGSQPASESLTEAREKHKLIFRRYLTGEFDLRQAEQEFRTAQTSGVFANGGALVTPVQVLSTILQAADDMTHFNSTNITEMMLESANSLGVPTIESDPADAEWTSELQVGSETNVGFGGRELTPNLLSKQMKMSYKLLRQVPNAEETVLTRLGYKFGITREKACLTADGVKKPLGLLVASAQGLNTDRDVSFAGTTPTWDKMMEIQNTLKASYQPRAKWMMHKNTLFTLRKVKDSQQRYLLDINTANTGPILNLLGSPILLSDYFTHAASAGVYSVIYGDFKFYWTARSQQYSVQRLNELYATSNSVGFIGREELDGMPVLAEAFVRGVYA